MREVQHDIVFGAVKSLYDVLGRSGKVDCLQAEVLQLGMKVLKTGNDIVATMMVIGVPENLYVGMKGFQGMLGVLGTVSVAQWRDVVLREYL